jgi:hypothetical protein
MVRLESTYTLAYRCQGRHGLHVLGWCAEPAWIDAVPPTWDWPPRPHSTTKQRR